MFRTTALFLAPAALCAAAETPQQAPAAKLPASHQEFSLALLDWLEQTEACLATCTDAAGVQAAMPRLRELGERAHALADCQRELPEPTVQDYLAAHEHVGDFNKRWYAIGDHIERLRTAGLLSPELRELLRIAPDEA